MVVSFTFISVLTEAIVFMPAFFVHDYFSQPLSGGEFSSHIIQIYYEVVICLEIRSTGVAPSSHAIDFFDLNIYLNIKKNLYILYIGGQICPDSPYPEIT